MLGYMTEEEALAEGFTHHGKYYGIPLWITDINNEFDVPLVATKFVWMEPLMTLGHYIENALWLLMGEEPRFVFQIGNKIGS